MESEISVARIEDAPALLGIYAYYVENTAVSFEYEVPSVEEFEARIARTLQKYPYICISHGGKILGYAYAGIFHEREAYKKSVELSVYIDKNARRNGYGKKLYAALEEELKKQGITNLYACIACPNEKEDKYLTNDSERFHKKMGFEIVGHFHKCGVKFGKFYDMIYMEKIIAEDKQK